MRFFNVFSKKNAAENNLAVSFPTVQPTESKEAVSNVPMTEARNLLQFPTQQAGLLMSFMAICIRTLRVRDLKMLW